MWRTLSLHLWVKTQTLSCQDSSFFTQKRLCSCGEVPGTEGGGKYNCDYCQKDITGKIRIKCAVCPDFDLCVECMSVGAEITPHKCDHAYRVMVRLIHQDKDSSFLYTLII